RFCLAVGGSGECAVPGCRLAIPRTASSRRLASWVISPAVSLDYLVGSRTAIAGCSAHFTGVVRSCACSGHRISGNCCATGSDYSDHAIPWVRQYLGAANTFNLHDWLVQRFPALADYVPSQEELLQHIGMAAKSAGAFLVTVLSRMTTTTATFVLNL